MLKTLYEYEVVVLFYTLWSVKSIHYLNHSVYTEKKKEKSQTQTGENKKNLKRKLKGI